MTMPHTPTITGTHTAASSPYQTIARFLDTIYGAESGYCCLGSIDGDPRYEAMHQEWYAWPRERRTVVHRLVHLTHCGRNVYTARCLFTSQKRSYATAVPSPWLWLDDAAADTDATLLIETSAQNYQAWLQLAHPVTADEASQLQRRWRQAAGADSCSADAVHMVRVPGSVNTKRHGCFAVNVAKYTNTTYRIDDLTWPDVPTATYARDGTTIDTRDLFDDTQIMQLCHELNRPETPLLKNAVSTVPYIQRIPARIKPGTQTYRVLTDADYRRGFRNPSGSWDASLVRYIVCKGLIFVGYDANHIAAFLDYLEDPDTQGIKGASNLVGDVQRLFTAEKLGALYAQKQRQQQRPCQLPQRKRRGRPSRVTPADVLAYWQHQAAGNRCIYTRKEMANALHISVRALDRHIKHLKDVGTAIIETPAHRQYSVAIFQEVPNARQDAVLGTAINTTEAPLIAHNEVLPAHTDAAQPDAENMRTHEHKGTHQAVFDRADDATTESTAGVCSSDTTTDQAAAGYPALWHAHESDLSVTVIAFLGLGPDGRAYVSIAESSTGIPFDEVTFLAPDQDPDATTAVPAAPDQVPDALPDQATSAPTVSLATAVAEAFDAITTRRTQKRIRTYLELNYPEMLQSDSALAAQIAYERRQRMWQQQIDVLKTKEHAYLMKLNKRVERIQKDVLEGEHDNRYGWACALAPYVAAELERREPMQDRANLKRARKRRETQRQASQQTVLPFATFQQADTTPTPVPIHTTYDAAGLITRLRQRQVRTA